MARVARAEQQPAATGTTLVVMVGLGVAFLLFMAFLNVVKSGNLLNDSNLLYAALIFYSRRGNALSWFRSHRHSFLCPLRFTGDLGGPDREYGRSCASLV